MSETEWPQDLNQTLVEKVRCGTSPTPKDRYDRSSNDESKRSSEIAKIRIQKDILDSLKEKDGTPLLVYPQDYIFDIAHFGANGNLGELIDDMSNIASPEEKFVMVKSENKILRERLHNALQREMKAIKTFQKLSNNNRLLRLKECEKVKTEVPLNDTTVVEQHGLMNGGLDSSMPIYNGEKIEQNKIGNDKNRSMINKSTSTSDLKEDMLNKSASTDNLPAEDLPPESEIEILNSKKVDTLEVCDDPKPHTKRRELFKAKRSPNILEELTGLSTTEIKDLARSGGLVDIEMQTKELSKTGRSASRDAINNQSRLSLVDYRKLNERRNVSFPGSLDVVNEETDQSKQIKSGSTDRSSGSSEGNISLTHSTSSDMEGNSSPCLTPSLEGETSEKMPFPPSESLNNSCVHSKSLPAKLNLEQQARLNESLEGNDCQLKSENESKKQTISSDSAACVLSTSLSEVPKTKKQEISEGLKLRKNSYSTGSLRYTSSGKLEDDVQVMSRQDGSKKKTEKSSSSDESDKEERFSTPQKRRRGGFIANNHIAADQLQKFQSIFNSRQIPQSAHESDDEQDILQACEAARNQRYSYRRGSAVVQIPASSLQMDLHVATKEPLEDKPVSRWSSILKHKKKLLLQRDRQRIAENLKDYLSTKVRHSRISSETELSLYRDTHWTHLMKVTDETGSFRRLSDADSQYCLTDTEMKRREAVWELFHSEVVYLTAHLLVLKECFLEPLREIQGKGFLVSIDDRKIFSNLDDLCEVSAKFANDLLRLFKNEQKDQFGSTASVVSAFTKFKWTVHRQYERYCLSYTSTLNYLEILKPMEDVQEFFKWCESDSRCNRLKLTDLLVAPFQHLTKYPLLLKNIRKRTSEGDVQHASLSSTIKYVEVLIQELESNITVVKNYQKLKELQKNLVWPSVGDLDPKSYIPELLKDVVARQECGRILASPKRQLIHEGILTLYENTKTDVFAFLFDDMLLLTKGTKKSNRHLRKISMGNQHGGSTQESLSVPSPAASRKGSRSEYNYTVYKQPLPIDRFVLHDLDTYQGNSIRNGFVLVHMSRFKQAIAIHTLQASSKKIKDIWISKLKETQGKWKEVFEQEDSKEKNLDGDCSNNNGTKKNNEGEKTYSDSEQESGSDHNSSNEDDIFNGNDMEVPAITDTNSDTNNNSNENTISDKNNRPKRERSHTTSAM